MSTLMEASSYGYIHIAEYLFRTGIPINYANEFSKTALTYSVEKKQFDTVRFLVDNGADLSVKDNIGWNLLMYACWFDNPDNSIGKYIVEKTIEKCSPSDGILLLKNSTSKKKHTALSLYFRRFSNDSEQMDSAFVEFCMELLGLNNIDSYLESDVALNKFLNLNPDTMNIWNLCKQNCFNRQRINNNFKTAIDGKEMRNESTTCFDR